MTTVVLRQVPRHSPIHRLWAGTKLMSVVLISITLLMATGVPAVLVPLPIATRDHQMANAEAVVATGGAVVVVDHELTTDRLEAELTALLADRAELRRRSAAMRQAATIDAAEQVAAVVERVARG